MAPLSLRAIPSSVFTLPSAVGWKPPPRLGSGLRGWGRGRGRESGGTADASPRRRYAESGEGWRPGPVLRLTATEGKLVRPLFGGVGWAVGNRRHFDQRGMTRVLPRTMLVPRRPLAFWMAATEVP